MSTLPSAPPERQHCLDLLRGAAVLLVIGHHLRLLQQRWNGASPWVVVEVSEALSPFRMPALLFASGLLLAHSLSKPAGAYLRGKLRGLLWPWLLWSVLLLPLVGWANAMHPLWWINGSYTWFLMALLLYYLVALLTRRLHPGWLALVSVVAWMVLPLAGVELHLAGSRPDKLIFYAVFFFAGAALRRTLTERTIPWPVLGLGLLLAAGWAVHAAWIGVKPMTPVVAQLVALIAVVCAVGALQRLPRLRALRPLEWVGRNSIVPYLVHLPVMELLCRHSDLPPSLTTYLLFYVLAVGVCVVALLLRPVTGFLYTFPAPRPAPRPRTAPRVVPADPALGGPPAQASVAAAVRR